MKNIKTQRSRVVFLCIKM